MEASAMEENHIIENHLTSAAAFVEGGIQEACDDACSICLEDFCDSDPSTVTSCKHEFHLQCILEWCQRSSQCPMCWQSISLKDPTSQELLEAVEQERSVRSNRPRNATIFHHPTFGDFELQHLPVGSNDAELEERIMQHLAAAAAMGRAHRIARRDSNRNRSTGQSLPQRLVLPSHPNTSSTVVPGSSAQEHLENETVPTIGTASPTSPLIALREDSSSGVPQLHASKPSDPRLASASASGVFLANQHVSASHNSNTASQSSSVKEDKAGPSDFQAFSEALKSRFSAVSTRYKESIAKSTKGWKERLFSRNTPVSDLGSQVQPELNAGIANVASLMERLDTRETNRTSEASVSENKEGNLVSEPGTQTAKAPSSNTLNENNPSASCAASSGSN